MAEEEEFIRISGWTDSVDLNGDQLPHVYIIYSTATVIYVMKVMHLPHHFATLCRPHSGVIPKLLFTDKQLHPWAARYNSWLLIKLTPKGVIFSSYILCHFAVTMFKPRDDQLIWLQPLQAGTCL